MHPDPIVPEISLIVLAMCIVIIDPITMVIVKCNEVEKIEHFNARL